MCFTCRFLDGRSSILISKYVWTIIKTLREAFGYLPNLRSTLCQPHLLWFSSLSIQMRILRLARKQTRAVADRDMIAIDRHRNHGELDIEVNAARYCCKRPMKTGVLRFYKQNKGIVTVSLQTGALILVWIPYILQFSVSFISLVHNFLDLIAIAGTWIQAIIYLNTNQEARSVCRNLFRTAPSILQYGYHITVMIVWTVGNALGLLAEKRIRIG